MHHYIGAHFQRPLQVRGAVGVVDDHDNVRVLMGNPRDGSDIHQLHVRVGRCFEVDHARCRADRRFKLGHVRHVDMLDLDPEFANAVV